MICYIRKLYFDKKLHVIFKNKKYIPDFQLKLIIGTLNF